MLGNFNPKSSGVIKRGVTAVYANKGLATAMDISLAGFQEDKPQSMMFVFGDILVPRTYAEIKKCEFSAKIIDRMKIEEIPVIVKFYLSTLAPTELPTLTSIPGDIPSENFLVKGEIGSNFKMNLTNLLRETLKWRKEFARLTTLVIHPTIDHPLPGYNVKIKTIRSSVKLLVEYILKGKSFLI